MTPREQTKLTLRLRRLQTLAATLAGNYWMLARRCDSPETAQSCEAAIRQAGSIRREIQARLNGTRPLNGIQRTP